MTDQRKRTGAKAPISAHPAFRVIVAAWFAALLGLGSLVLPVALFERLSEASGLASLLAVAQAPLGLTARLLIALGAAGLGTVAGLAIARQVVAANGPKARPPVAPASGLQPLKRPISAHDELGEDGFDADFDEPVSPQTARHAHTMASAVVDEALEPAATTPLELAAFASPPEEDVAADDWISEDRKREARDQADSEGGSAPPELAAEAASETFEQSDAPSAESVLAAPVPARALNELSMVELVERFARALQQHQDSARSAPGDDDTVVDLTAALAVKAVEQPANPQHQAEDAVDEAGHDEHESYSSLLAMKSPFTAQRDRAPASGPRGTESALREALAKLQAMSGAA